MSISRSEQLIEYAKNLFAGEKIDVDDLEDRIHRALTGEATDEEWIDAARYHRFTSPHTGLGSLENVDSILKAAYRGPIAEQS